MRQTSGRAAELQSIGGADHCSDFHPEADRRSAPRKAMCGAGLLSSAGLKQPLPCRIVDFSGFGARLRFDCETARYQLGSIRTPSQIKLTIVAERTEAECAIVWRTGQEMGVRLKYALRSKAT